MSKIKPQLSKGTRDFLPQEVARRNYIFDTIKSVFRKYGFEQIETPAIERLETLTGKYGEEGDKLLFKILNSGEYMQNVPAELLATTNSKQVTPYLAEKGLRYDLTVPLARYVVQHQDQLAFPFKRFHIGPVWRADRPQKGRYQEFYQCDADVIGSNSLWNEVELTNIYLEVFEKLNIPVTVRIINRRMIDEVLGNNDIHTNRKEVITIIDKLDKVSWDGDNGIAAQLALLGLNPQQITNLHAYLFTTNYENFKAHVHNLDTQHDVTFVLRNFTGNSSVSFDPSLMRGLDYYTGTVWEVKANAGSINSSLGGGGRYDNLTEMFGGQNMSGVGISFGVERIYDVMDELQLFPEQRNDSCRLLLVARDIEAEDFVYATAQTLRQAGKSVDIFTGNVKKGKHFQYAEKKQIPFLAEVGTDEVNSGILRIKELASRQEHKVDIQALTQLI